MPGMSLMGYGSVALLLLGFPFNTANTTNYNQIHHIGSGGRYRTSIIEEWFVLLCLCDCWAQHFVGIYILMKPFKSNNI